MRKLFWYGFGCAVVAIGYVVQCIGRKMRGEQKSATPQPQPIVIINDHRGHEFGWMGDVPEMREWLGPIQDWKDVN